MTTQAHAKFPKSQNHQQTIQSIPTETKTESTDGRPASKVTGPTAKDQELSQLIQIRAYELWEQAGRPHSDETRERFWRQAERELTSSPVQTE